MLCWRRWEKATDWSRAENSAWKAGTKNSSNTICSVFFGFADVASKRPFRLESPVVIASISKPLVGTTAFRLSQKEKLDLLVLVSKYLPELLKGVLESGVPLKRAPTTQELLMHISGMRGSEAPGGRPWLASWTEGKLLGEVVQRDEVEFPFKAQRGEA